MELPYNFESESRYSIFTGELFQGALFILGPRGRFTCLGDLVSSAAHTYSSRMLENYSFNIWFKNVLIQLLKMK